MNKKMRDAKLAKYLKKLDKKELTHGLLVRKSKLGDITFCANGACLTVPEVDKYLNNLLSADTFYKIVDKRVNTNSANIAIENDKWGGSEKPADRYKRMLAWAEERIPQETKSI